ncbi:MAG TPA: ABC transporter permease [Burkholderiales bacterium]|nr:ABC transporter permease [Burkholderiales bacterium]
MGEAALPITDRRPESAPDLEVTQGPGGSARVVLHGAWNLRSLERVIPEMQARLAEFGPGTAWDLSLVSTMDHAGALLLWRAWGRRMAASVDLRDDQAAFFEHLDVPASSVAGRPRRHWIRPLLALGGTLLSFVEHLTGLLILMGRVALDGLHLAAKPRDIPWKEISANLYRTGAQALGITALVGFLVGIVLSYLSSQQLKSFGADIFIVNLLGIAIIRELGPVLAAILVAGRSGSAITAQIGVMRVTEELDALAVMGIPHTLRLVLPKVVALAIAMPLLILWTNAVALIGGMLSAQIELGIDYRHFAATLPDAVPIANLWLGLGKGVVFGILIALIACHYGLRIKPNTESLGVGTTNSVVTAITVVIVVDAIFAIMFSSIGIYS